MKKRNVLIITIISLIITFLFSELFSIYHFGDIPSLLTLFYLISMFSIFEYISISITYVIIKLIKKQKIGIKKVIGLILVFIALILILFLGIVLEIDWLNWYAYSAPFYINVIIKMIKYLLPAILFLIVGIRFIKNKK